jgi:hypothetical protein
VPGDRGRDGVDATVDARGDELDPARVGGARHAGARIAGSVELLLGLGGEPVQQRGHVAALEVLGVDLDRAARLAEAARVPRQHVEARAAQRPEADLADRRQRGAVLVLVAHRAPAVGLEDGRRRLARRETLRREEARADRRAVEGRDDDVAGTGGRRDHEGRRGDRRCHERTNARVHSRHGVTSRSSMRRFLFFRVSQRP